MIIVKLQGGLGNQMFQYSLGRHLSIRNKTNLKFDISSLGLKDPSNTKRNYSLSVFKVEESFATDKEIGWFKKYKFKKGKLWFWYNRTIASRKKYLWEENINFENQILFMNNPIYIDGWWQKESYFKEISEIIKKDFTLKKELSEYSKKIEREIKNSNSVSIHVRRGDYVSDKKTNEWIGVCSPEYYESAINEIKKKISNPHFFIFSDDQGWAKLNIKTGSPTIYVSENSNRPEEDMYLMSLCKNNIIANSSFSWWGAWLNKNNNKIVIAPKRWFKAEKMSKFGIIPDSWIKI